MKLKRGQGVIEFMIIFAAVIFFFILFFAVVQKNIEKKNSEKEQLIAQNVALNVQSEMNLAFESSEGYYREFTIPQNILGKNYEINLTSGLVYVSLDKFGVSYRIPVFEGDIQKGENVIRKQDGKIYLN